MCFCETHTRVMLELIDIALFGAKIFVPVYVIFSIKIQNAIT